MQTSDITTSSPTAIDINIIREGNIKLDDRLAVPGTESPFISDERRKLAMNMAIDFNRGHGSAVAKLVRDAEAIFNYLSFGTVLKDEHANSSFTSTGRQL